MRNSPPFSPNDDLALTALRFAAGELSSESAQEFADRMAHDQAARDALSDAIRLSAAALGQSAPMPDSLNREAVREQVRGTWLGRLFPRRPYRGHPIAWAGMGGAVAAAATVFGVWLGDAPPIETPTPQPIPVLVKGVEDQSTKPVQMAFVGPPAPTAADLLAVDSPMPLILEPNEPENSALATTNEPVNTAEEKTRPATGNTSFEKPSRPGEVRAGD